LRDRGSASDGGAHEPGTVAAQDMIARFAEWQGREPASVAADATYGNGEFLQWLNGAGDHSVYATRDSALRKNNPLYGPDASPIFPKTNSYLCPAGQPTQLRRFECEESNPRLHRKPQTLRCVVRKRRNAPRASTSILPSTCMSPRATRSRLSQLASLRERTTGKKESGSAVRGTQKSRSDFVVCAAKTKVCSRAVLPGSGCAEHSSDWPLPQPRTKATAHRNRLVF